VGVRNGTPQRVRTGRPVPGEFGYRSQDAAILKQEHLLTSRQGRGTHVNDQSALDRLQRFFRLRTPSDQPIVGGVHAASVTEGGATAQEAFRLALTEGEPVCRINRLRRVDGRPMMYEESRVPTALFPDLARRETLPHLIVVLAQEFGILLGKGTERISIEAATPDLASHLDVAPGTPLLLLDRLVANIDGTPIEWRGAHCHLAENHYYVEFA
jgi:GntR family transcriptional regulator